ncbi:MFS transporter [Clostridium tarantellae]|uniref:MFS transporter n=1 Tax=Clostridium tarantellae TaxID=39493 RepID=A0A6I1MLG2_9CLOT|nr:MFS transporter [Clostridium tarantellae]
MIFVCMFMQAIPFGIAQNIQPLFVPYVVRHFNFSLASFSLIFTFGALASSVCSPFLGKLFGKVNIKILFIIGTTLSSLGFFLFGLAHNLPEFYIYSAICQVGCVLFSGLGVPYVINNWFPGNGRGKALGLAFSGGSIGNVFLQEITSHILATKGPSTSYLIFGVASIIISLPTILLFIRLPKSEELDNNIDERLKDRKVLTKAFQGEGIKVVRKNPFFWTFAVGYALIGISIAALSTQYATYFTNGLKLSPTLVGTLGSTFAVFCLVGNIGGGVLFDRLGTIKAMSIAGILEITAVLGMLIASKISVFAFLFSIAYGLCVYCYMSGPAFMATDVFGRKDSSVILGTISLLFAIGFALGSTIFGSLVDHFGFKIAWIGMLGFILVGYIILLLSIKKCKEENEKLEENIFKNEKQTA